MELARAALAVLNQYLLFACLGGLAFLVGLASTDYTKVLLVSFALFFGLFVLNISQEGKGGVLSLLNPYHYYGATRILFEGSPPWRDYLVLSVVAAAAWGLGLRIYVRKEV
ncbi:MAG: hypothetical protein GX493_00580 [Firmicutes bacterium]|nr:hypothetical protein [Bacillota bacterium]